MMLHFFIIGLQAVVLAAFLILWYFWVKKRMEAAFVMEDEEQVLFPFRYFSWIVLALVVLTAVAQVHFVRTSAGIHEKMAAMSDIYSKYQLTSRSLEELKASMDKLRKETDNNFKGLKAQIPDRLALMKTDPITSDLVASPPPVPEKSPLMGPTARAGNPGKDGFAGEAKASTARTIKTAAVDPAIGTPFESSESAVHSMRLNRQARVLIDRLRVRKQPRSDAPPVEHLMAGQQVKVTEKRLLNDNVWFRVVTPSGRAGWVDYRYLRLEGNA